MPILQFLMAHQSRTDNTQAQPTLKPGMLQNLPGHPLETRFRICLPNLDPRPLGLPRSIISGRIRICTCTIPIPSHIDRDWGLPSIFVITVIIPVEVREFGVCAPYALHRADIVVH